MADSPRPNRGSRIDGKARLTRGVSVQGGAGDQPTKITAQERDARAPVTAWPEAVTHKRRPAYDAPTRTESRGRESSATASIVGASQWSRVARRSNSSQGRDRHRQSHRDAGKPDESSGTAGDDPTRIDRAASAQPARLMPPELASGNAPGRCAARRQTKNASPSECLEQQHERLCSPTVAEGALRTDRQTSASRPRAISRQVIASELTE